MHVVGQRELDRDLDILVLPLQATSSQFETSGNGSQRSAHGLHSLALCLNGMLCEYSSESSTGTTPAAHCQCAFAARPYNTVYRSDTSRSPPVRH